MCHDDRPSNCFAGQGSLPDEMTTTSHVAMDHVEIKANHLVAHEERAGDFWVFGYGSLMWHPGFPHAERLPAIAHGVHRRLCVYSHRYRGTPEKPGLVMGLLAGGCCHGMAFRVRGEDAAATRDYLTRREQVSKVYHEVFRPVRLRDGRRIAALCYVVDQRHRQFAGRLCRDTQLALIRDSHGQRGPNRDYVRNTADMLAEIGCEDRTLSWLSRRLGD
jgi:cation transport protein ChaC